MGENEKVTKMVLKVDLQCEKYYRKVKKVLCKFPEIRDQTYDEKKNQVIIKVVCCSPEKIRDKLSCKGRCVIKSIDIIVSPPVTPPPASEPVKPDKKKTDGVKCMCPPVHCKCPPVHCKCPLVKCPRPPVNTCRTECNRGHLGGPCQTGCRCRVPDPCRQYDCHCGRLVYDSYSCWRSYNTSSYCVTRTDCFIEENLQVCAIM